MAVEVVEYKSSHAECVSCLSTAGPIVSLRAGYKHGDGSIVWTVIRLCPICRFALLQKLAAPADSEAEAYSLTHATVIMGVMHGIIEEFREALGSVVDAFRDGDPVDVGKLKTVLETTQRRLTGNITDVPG